MSRQRFKEVRRTNGRTGARQVQNFAQQQNRLRVEVAKLRQQRLDQGKVPERAPVQAGSA